MYVLYCYPTQSRHREDIKIARSPAPPDQKYNDGFNLLEDLFEFHPEFFDQLAADDMRALQVYYLVGVEELPNDIFAYKQQIDKTQPEIAAHANNAIRKLQQIAGMGSI